VKKVLVSFDEELLRRVDRVASARGLTRSGYLAALAERDVVRNGPGASAAARRALAQLDQLFADAPKDGEDSTEAIRSERDRR
jgi:hypothetical protein